MDEWASIWIRSATIWVSGLEMGLELGTGFGFDFWIGLYEMKRYSIDLKATSLMSLTAGSTLGCGMILLSLLFVEGWTNPLSRLWIFLGEGGMLRGSFGWMMYGSGVE